MYFEGGADRLEVGYKGKRQSWGLSTWKDGDLGVGEGLAVGEGRRLKVS